MTEQQIRIFAILKAATGPLTCAQIAALIGDCATVSSIATQISRMRNELPEGAILARPGRGGVWLVASHAEPRGCADCGKSLRRRDSTRCLPCANAHGAGPRKQTDHPQRRCDALLTATMRLFQRRADEMGCDVVTAGLRLHGHAA